MLDGYLIQWASPIIVNLFIQVLVLIIFITIKKWNSKSYRYSRKQFTEFGKNKNFLNSNSFNLSEALESRRKLLNHNKNVKEKTRIKPLSKIHNDSNGNIVDSSEQKLDICNKNVFKIKQEEVNYSGSNTLSKVEQKTFRKMLKLVIETQKSHLVSEANHPSIKGKDRKKFNKNLKKKLSEYFIFKQSSKH